MRSPEIRCAVSGSSFASSLSAACACVIERISIQWPRTMIVTRVASSHQRSIPGKPKVTARLKMNATLIASAMRVIGAQTSVGIERSSVPRNFWRSISTDWPACLSWPVCSS